MPAVWLPAVSLSLEDESLLSEVTTSPPFPWPGVAEFSSGAHLWNPSLAPSLDPQAPLGYGRALGSSQAKPDLKKQPDSQWQWGPRLWGRVLTLRAPCGERERDWGSREEPVPGYTAWLAVLWFLKNSHWEHAQPGQRVELEPLEGKVGIFSLYC